MVVSSSRDRVVVAGAGVSGLLLARRLAAAGLEVVVLEATPTAGGQIHAVEVAGHRVDVGAEALHLGAPAAAALVDELGLTADIVGARPGTSWLWTRRGRRRLPAGVGPAGPTRLRPVLASRIMSLPGLLRAGLEPLAARRRPALGDGDDVAVGEFVAGRFGREVTRRFVDPLLGGLHSGNVDRLSLRACAPGLVGAAAQRRSLLARRPAPPPAGGPPPVMFASWPEGLGTLVDRLRDGLDVRTGHPVTGVAATPAGGYAVTTGGEEPQTFSADRVVLALPAAAAAGLVRDASPVAADALAGVETASTASVLLGFPREQVAHLPALAGNGVLVPSEFDTLLKAVTLLSTKWPQLRDDDTYLVRVSAGRAGADAVARLDDETLVARLLDDLRRFTGIDVPPTHVHVHRWERGVPQLVVGHGARIASARAALAADAPGVSLVGASYDGVGLSNCIASANAQAEAILASRDERPAEVAR